MASSSAPISAEPPQSRPTNPTAASWPVRDLKASRAAMMACWSSGEPPTVATALASTPAAMPGSWRNTPSTVTVTSTIGKMANSVFQAIT